MDIVELSRLVENIVRIGTIHSVDHAAARCRVSTGRLVTQWLPWHERRAGETRTWTPPTVGEQCMILSPSGEPAAGVVLVGIYSNAKPAPSDNPDEHVTLYPDGTRIAYDHAAHRLTVHSVGDVVVRADADAQISVGGNAEIRIGGWGQIIATGELLVKSVTRLILKGPSRRLVL